MRTKLFFCMTGCLIAAMFISSCSKSSDSEEDLLDPLIGYWESYYKIDDAYVGLQFDKGGSGMFCAYTYAYGTAGSRFLSTWSRTDNVLLIIANGSSTRYTYSISGNTMQLTSNGQTNQFSRGTPRAGGGGSTGGSGTGGSSVSHEHTLDYWQTKYDGYVQDAITAYNNYYKTDNRFTKLAYKSNFERAQANMISTSAKASIDGWTLTKSAWQTKSL